MSFVKGLQCRECGRQYPVKLLAGCEHCFGPLEADYHYEAIAKKLTRDVLSSRPKTIWKYRELLPLESEPKIGLATGGTPLVRADRLSRKLGIDNLYLKNDSVNSPTLSFKDRVTAVAINKALEFKLEAVGCASTGNLANSVAANAAAAGLPSFILIPDNLESSKVAATQIYGSRLIMVRGNYDAVNRLCSQIVDRYPWGFVNVNLRPFYAEGSKTIGYEIAEQLGWPADCTDDEIVAGIQHVAETEGIFTETAGGVTVAVAQKLVQQGRIKPKDLTVLAITGNGLKTLEALDLAPPQVIEPKLAAFERVFGGAYHAA